MIGCTEVDGTVELRAVSGILRTQRGRRGSGRVRLRAGTASAGPALCGRVRPPSPPSHAATIPAPVAQLSAASPLAPVAQSPPPRCFSPLWLNSGLRRAPPTSHWSWVTSRAARQGCWIAGPYRHCRPRRRAVGRARAGTSGRRSPTAPCISGARRQSEQALSCARIAGPSHCGGSPAPRGCAGPEDTGPSAASQSLSAWHHC